MDVPVDLGSVRVFAVIAGGSDNDDACVYQGPRGATDGIVLVRADRRGSKTHVDDPNIVLVLVQRVGRAKRFGWIRRAKNPVECV